MCRAGHLVRGVWVGNVDGEERGGGGGRGVRSVACDRGSLGAEGGELAREAVDLACISSGDGCEL